MPSSEISKLDVCIEIIQNHNAFWQYTSLLKTAEKYKTFLLLYLQLHSLSVFIGFATKTLPNYNTFKNMHNLADRVFFTITKRYSYHSSVVAHLIMYSVQNTSLTFKAFHSLEPHYLCELLHPNIPTRSLWTSEFRLLLFPRFQPFYMGDRSLLVKAVHFHWHFPVSFHFHL